jgi:hypothetical protein
MLMDETSLAPSSGTTPAAGPAHSQSSGEVSLSISIVHLHSLSHYETFQKPFETLHSQ